MITLILDGYNVIGAIPELSRQWDRNARAAREALIGLCEAYRALRKDIERLYVVFDGSALYAHEPQRLRGAVTVLFTQGEEADERIVNLVKEAGSGSRLVVVSDDRDVRHTVRAHGARVLSVREFSAKLRPARVRPSAPPGVEEKPMPSPLEARRITVELQQHLEARARSQRARRTCAP